MIVPTMNSDELYRELAADRPSLAAWFEHRQREIVKQARGMAHFPVAVWLSYRSPRKNNYLVQVTIFSRRCDKHATMSFICYFHSPDGLTTCTSWVSEKTFVDPIIITPHAWLRYAQRMDVKKSGPDLIRHFFNNNDDGVSTSDNRLMGQSVRYNGADLLALCMTEGVMLGETHGNIFIGRTYITYDMCSGRQAKHFNDRRRDMFSPEEKLKMLKQYTT